MKNIICNITGALYLALPIASWLLMLSENIKVVGFSATISFLVAVAMGWEIAVYDSSVWSGLIIFSVGFLPSLYAVIVVYKIHGWKGGER